MRSYGSRKATEFTKKQIGVIYRLAKERKLEVEKGEMADLYNLADYYGYDDNGNVARNESYILSILEDVFSNNLKSAQEKINELQKNTFESLSIKNQRRWDKAFV